MEYIDTFQRVEHKYLLTSAQAEEIKARFSSFLREDVYPRYALNNIYYDSPDQVMIRRSLESPCYKEKLRLRCYGEPDEGKPVFLEIKKKYDGIVYKRRIEMGLSEAMAYLNNEEHMGNHGQIGKEIDYLKQFYQIEPKVFLSYDREAYAGIQEEDVRITFDTNIQYRSLNVTLASTGNEDSLMKTDQVVMEVKVMDRYPLWLANSLTEMRLFRIPFSKYGMIYRKQAMPAPERMIVWNYLKEKESEEKTCLVPF